ncbi:hypothetical protein [Desulfolutivibrio sulfoxidireducens]|uniref:hypothetical protein n=1 Tax=Desulfolutivibrio sulfoxidireducens TaxID=2773299 RepID=UPI00159D9136|nr:hypothetical protein [Desulfolutivibrio sulfoxidireducens]QLA17722.1 hypothetical protein GD605_17370 [Desulfolutivibrio sulfoxidireducens]QLA21296.1 hypothetical protein GD604_16980 [Desulfolutivibrio sulfoxidireducens]
MDRMEPAVRAALVHYHLLALRPFSRACAVMARLAEAMVLEAAGYRFAPAVLGEYYLTHLGEYEGRAPLHPAGRAGEDPATDRAAPSSRPPAGELADDPTPFVEFCLRGLAWGLREAQERVAEGLRRLVLERHFEELRLARRVTARQHALLRLLLDGGHGPVGIRALCRASPFSLLYGRASEQTARRDLKRLSRLGLLASLDDGFVLDRRALCV